jgi:hypothetical protein
VTASAGAASRRLTVFVAAAALAAGCGGGGERLSKSAYEQRLRAVARPLNAVLARPEPSNPSTSRLVRRVGEIQAGLRRAARELDGLRPPEDAERTNSRLVEGMRAFADALEEVRVAARSGRAEAVREASSAAGRSALEMNHAFGELADAGYDVGG